MLSIAVSHFQCELNSVQAIGLVSRNKRAPHLGILGSELSLQAAQGICLVSSAMQAVVMLHMPLSPEGQRHKSIV